MRDWGASGGRLHARLANIRVASATQDGIQNVPVPAGVDKFRSTLVIRHVFADLLCEPASCPAHGVCASDSVRCWSADRRRRLEATARRVGSHRLSCGSDVLTRC